MRPLAVDLFCGLGGWSEGLLAAGFDVVGFDIERHDYGDGHRYPGTLVIQDVLTLHGAQFRDAALIVASPPCQAYSYRAMPWKRAKALPPPDNTLFDACFRIRREASEAAGHRVPLIVENVRGAQKWVGRARWNYGSFYLWGDVPALMPITSRGKIGGGANVPGIGWTGFADTGASWRNREHVKVAGQDWNNYRRAGAVSPDWRAEAIKRTSGGSWFGDYQAMKDAGTKHGGECFHDPTWASRISSSGSPARKRASALIAKIPAPLAAHIASVFLPHTATNCS